MDHSYEQKKPISNILMTTRKDNLRCEDLWIMIFVHIVRIFIVMRSVAQRRRCYRSLVQQDFENDVHLNRAVIYNFELLI